ncbi:hypothetical protein [uncultured Sulfitobacter sp.]|uniref:hypothetical protein n=1 Tax=uncultured Sulfitobacter sp. TaxID=191468 RepID=UPI002599BA7E|nr:hypothetical protein [uncultured Sulfitobacter sp.]
MREIPPPPQPETESTETLELTEEEIDYLLEYLAGVNHPTGQSILAKLEGMKNEPANNQD